MTITIWLVAGQTTFLDLDQLKILVNVDYQSIPCLAVRAVSRAVSRQSHGWEQIITVRAVRAVSRAVRRQSHGLEQIITGTCR